MIIEQKLEGSIAPASAESKPEPAEAKRAEPAEARRPEPAVKAPEPKSSKRKGAPTDIIFKKSKRKRSIARASGRPGSGTIRVNGRLIDTINPLELRFEMLKGIYMSETTKEIFRTLDINVNVHGGGTSSQAQAVAASIARIIAEKGGEPVKSMMVQYDRRLIIDDSRRVEPKKFLGPKARARFQTSYR